eukprot:417427_1
MEEAKQKGKGKGYTLNRYTKLTNQHMKHISDFLLRSNEWQSIVDGATLGVAAISGERIDALYNNKANEFDRIIRDGLPNCIIYLASKVCDKTHTGGLKDYKIQREDIRIYDIESKSGFNPYKLINRYIEMAWPNAGDLNNDDNIKSMWRNGYKKN